MPKFQTRKTNGDLMDAVEYSPMIFTVGSVSHRLALHLDTNGCWQLSHPATGIRVCDVYNTYKGVPCSSANIGKAMAKELAKASFESLIARHGSDKFNDAIAKMTMTYGDQEKAQREADRNNQSLMRSMSRTARKAAY